MTGRHFLRVALATAALAALGCSPTSVLSTEGAVGGALGAAGGTGIGYAIGQSIGKTTENMLLAGTIGSGLGLMAGGLLYEHNVFSSQEREVIIRRAQRINSQQREIDALREDMFERSSWGRSEVKGWNDRYWGESPNTPYEGTLTR